MSGGSAGCEKNWILTGLPLATCELETIVTEPIEFYATPLMLGGKSASRPKRTLVISS
jgi:hypothetical protein